MLPLLKGIVQALLGSRPAVTYLLYDAFLTDLAAGAVNGTLSESPVATGGGVVRTVTDTNSVLSTVGGVLNFATGGSAAGNPGLWYPSMTRQAGLMLFTRDVPASTNARVEAGWDTNQAGILAESIQLATSGGIAVVRASSSITVGVFTAVPYDLCSILRGTGTFHFIKGGAFTNWTLLFISNNSSANMSPGFGSSSTTTVYTGDNIRVPVALYVPPVLAYDTFTRADGALGSTEGTGPDGQILSALVWNFTSGIWAIVSNVAVGTPGVGAEVIVNGGFGTDTDWTKGAGWTIAAGTAVATAASSDLTAAVAPLTLGTWYQTVFTQGGFSAGTVAVVLGTTVFPTHAANGTFTETGRATSTAFALRGVGLTDTIDNVSAKPITLADLFSSVTVSTPDVLSDVSITRTAGYQSGLVLNLDSVATPANFVIAYLDGSGNAKLDKCVAGTYTNVISAAITYSAGAVLRVIKNGTSYSLFYNQLAVGSVSTISDAGIINNLNHGLFSTSALNSLDAFTLWPRGTSNEFSQLDLY